MAQQLTFINGYGQVPFSNIARNIELNGGETIDPDVLIIKDNNAQLNDRINALTRVIQKFNTNYYVLGATITPVSLEDFKIWQLLGYNFNNPIILYDIDKQTYNQHELADDMDDFIGLLSIGYSLCTPDLHPKDRNDLDIDESYSIRPDGIYVVDSTIIDPIIQQASAIKIIDYTSINPYIAFTHLLEDLFAMNTNYDKNTVSTIANNAVRNAKCQFDIRNYIPIIDQMIQYLSSDPTNQDKIDHFLTIRNTLTGNPMLPIIKVIPPHGQFPGGTEYHEMINEEFGINPIKNEIMSLNATQTSKIDEMFQLLKINRQFNSYQDALNYLRSFASQL